MKVAIVTLGCPKNEVDSLVMANYLVRSGIEVVEPDHADTIIVNTCGFIEDAKRESIDEILKWVEEGREVWVAGCLAVRYKGEIERLIPEVKGWIYLNGIKEVASLLMKRETPKRVIDEEKNYLPYFRDIEGSKLGSSVYIKISDGCDNRCAYCAIPIIRGKLRSRPIGDIVEEVRYHIENGAFEINLISQDTTSYGKDLNDGSNLLKLLEEITKIDGRYRVRLLYTHPSGIDEKLLDFILQSEKIVPYIDMPIQHINDDILGLMNRRGGKSAVLRALELIKERGIFLRTTILVGHPGETEETVKELIEFLLDIRPWRIAVFAYSREEGTKSYRIKAPPKRLIRDWVNEVQDVATRIMEEESRSIVGSVREVFVTEKEARLDIQAPEVDGCVLNIKGFEKTGIYRARIVDSNFVDFIVERV